MGIEQYNMRETWVEAENVIFPFISHLESRRVISLPREFNTESPNTPENNCTTMKDKISIFKNSFICQDKVVWFMVPCLSACLESHGAALSPG